MRDPLLRNDRLPVREAMNKIEKQLDEIDLQYEEYMNAEIDRQQSLEYEEHLESVGRALIVAAFAVWSECEAVGSPSLGSVQKLGAALKQGAALSLWGGTK